MSLPLNDRYKVGYLIIGPESSGSVFISKVISFVTKSCKYYGEWDGYGFNKKLGEDNLILHRSIPFLRPKQFHSSVKEIVDEYFKGYKMAYVLTTRDMNISIMSKLRRFDGYSTSSHASARMDFKRSEAIFTDMILNYNTFIWNYETMLILKGSYFFTLYKFLNIESDFVPEIYDGNKP